MFVEYLIVTVMPMRGLQDSVIPELWSEHALKHVDHAPHGRGHPMVVMLEQDHKHVEVAEVVLEPLDHRLDVIGLVPEMFTTTITSDDDRRTVS